MSIRSGIAAAIVASVVAVSSPAAWGANASFFAVLEGGSELMGAGDADAYGVATIMIPDAAGKICFAILVRNTDTPTAAHIHTGGVASSGGIVITLTKPNSGNPGHSSGCLTGQNQTTLNNIRATPSKFYINVHTTAKSGGALRGQLF